MGLQEWGKLDSAVFRFISSNLDLKFLIIFPMNLQILIKLG